MSHIDVLAPPNAEGTRATVLRWCKQVGDAVAKDEPLVELETDKVTVEIPAPASGTLIEVLKQVNAEVIPDEVLARLDLAAPSMTRQATASPAAAAAPMPQAAADAREQLTALSPAVRRLLKEHSIAAADIGGTGRDGRITAQDVIRQAASAANGAKAAKAADAIEPVKRVPAPHARTPGAAGGVTRVPHTAIRRRVAEHMARSLLESPHVTTLFEADLTRVMAHRAAHAADYLTRGARLTLTAYIVSACAHALQAIPEVNAIFHADALELYTDANIGVGTALGNKGLIVPVIHRAQTLNLFAIAQRLGQVVAAARAGKLAPEEVRGGTFTISNHGVGGSLLAAPIVINQPQVAILGVGKVERRVRVVQIDGAEAMSVRSMCYLTLTIDHRALDAFQANAFLGSVVGTLDSWPA
jgi:2-oxoglutarate dehydrogenase E2 component (dihydrolipoamide succinyltransferase)